MTFEEKIKQFWKWFGEEMDESEISLSARSEKYLDLISRVVEMEEGLVVDVGRDEAGRQVLVVSANDVMANFNKVVKMVDEAPKLQHWQVLAFRQPQTAHLNISIQGLLIETSNAFYEVLNSIPEKVSVNVWLIGDEIDSILRQAAEVMVANKVGEYVYATRVELVGVYKVDQQKDYQGKLLPMVKINTDERVMGSGGN